jgi:mannosyltransferase OCH1-like enzyme
VRCGTALGALLLLALLALGLLAAAPAMLRTARGARALPRPGPGSAAEQESADLPPRIAPHELLARLPQLPRVANSSVPKIIHQSYKSRALPPDFGSYHSSWLQHHPGWLYAFWTDEDNRAMVGLQGAAGGGLPACSAAAACHSARSMSCAPRAELLQAW